MRNLLFIITMIISFLFFPYPKEIGKNVYLPKNSIENNANLNNGLKLSLSIANAQSSKEPISEEKEASPNQYLLEYLKNLSNIKKDLPQPIYAIFQMYEFDRNIYAKETPIDWIRLTELPGYTTDIILNSIDKTFLLRDNKLNFFDFAYLIIKSMDDSNNNERTFTLEESLANNTLKESSSPKNSKILRLFLTTYIKSHYTKNEILEMYINTSRYGDKSVGIKAAAKDFYNESPAKLTKEQSTSLAELLYKSNVPTYL